MPSVTTVLRDDSKFDGWRSTRREESQRDLAGRLSSRTWTHDSAEHYLWTYEEPDFHYIYQPWWTSIKPFLDTIDHTLLTEGALWNSDNYAGACDCIAYEAVRDVP